MSKDDSLRDLIERVERAPGGSRELDHAIADAVLGKVKPPYVRGHCEKYSTSIDAAMTLVPEGWWLCGFYFCHPDFRSQQDRAWCAELAGPVTWAVMDREVGEEPQYDHVCASAANPALALCAASLRAHMGTGG